jgi:mannose-6-phosphate isomerase-like protein (cupin superfamily)
MTTQLKLTPSESLEIRQSSPEALEVVATYGAGGSPPPKHLHPQQDEHFEVLSGTIHARVEDEERTLGAGEEIEIPLGALHQMWNPGAEPAQVLWRTTPGGRSEQWFRSVDALHRSGRVGKDGMPSPIAFAVLLREFDDTIRLAGPAPLLRPALAAMALIGRARGYSVPNG